MPNKHFLQGDHSVAKEAHADASEHDLRHDQGGQVLGLPAVLVHGQGAEDCHQEGSQRGL